MRVALHSTTKALSEARLRCGTLDAVIAVHGIQGVSKGTLSRILRGVEGVSQESERTVREALNVERKRPPCFRPRLDREPRRRIAQLERLMEQAENELLDQGREP